jgi:oligogalacturonide lyase
MEQAGHDIPACSRRSFLFAIPAACLAASKIVPSAFHRYSDPSTEFAVLRLTDPSFTSLLPAHYQRILARRTNFLLFASDLSGRMEAYRMDLKTGAAHQLTEQEGLSPASLSFTPDERAVCCVAGDRLLSIQIATNRVREIYRAPRGFRAPGGLGLSEDGLYAAIIEATDAMHRLRLVHMADGAASTIAQSPEEMRDPQPRPRRASVLYRRGKSLWIANYDGQQSYSLRLAEGETGPATWSPDGRAVLYLNYPADPRRLHNIREFTPDANEEKAVADTTQFIAFERNADASVFAGASGSKASPHVLLLVRAVKRELTLCEHRASDPAMVSPVFSPNSQQVFFVSDRDGKPAIYSIAVERLVEETGGQ